MNVHKYREHLYFINVHKIYSVYNTVEGIIAARKGLCNDVIYQTLDTIFDLCSKRPLAYLKLSVFTQI